MRISRYIEGLRLTNPGSGYASAPVVTISAPEAGGVQATATAVLKGDQVGGFILTNGGAKYPAGTPTVTISAPPAGGTQATAEARTVGWNDTFTRENNWRSERFYGMFVQAIRERLSPPTTYNPNTSTTVEFSNHGSVCSSVSAGADAWSNYRFIAQQIYNLAGGSSGPSTYCQASGSSFTMALLMAATGRSQTGFTRKYPRELLEPNPSGGTSGQVARQSGSGVASIIQTADNYILGAPTFAPYIIVHGTYPVADNPRGVLARFRAVYGSPDPVFGYKIAGWEVVPEPGMPANYRRGSGYHVAPTTGIAQEAQPAVGTRCLWYFNHDAAYSVMKPNGSGGLMYARNLDCKAVLIDNPNLGKIMIHDGTNWVVAEDQSLMPDIITETDSTGPQHGDYIIPENFNEIRDCINQLMYTKTGSSPVVTWPFVYNSATV